MTVLDVDSDEFDQGPGRPETALSDAVEGQWQHVRARLRDEVGEPAYRSWLSAMVLLSASPGRVRIGVPSPFLREWIDSHYLNRLRALWMAVSPDVRRVDLLVLDDASAQATECRDGIQPANRYPGTRASSSRALSERPRSDRGFEKVPAVARRIEEPPMQDEPLDPSGADPSGTDNDSESGAWLDPRYTFETFVVGGPNELAHAAARRVAEAAVSDARAAPFNPLFLHGGVGLGKTHLMHAIAWHIRRNNPARKVMYLSAETFMFQFVRALRYKDTLAFKDQFRSVDVLMLDDVQFIGHKESTQEEFFHTFNALVEQSKQMVISADKSPQQLEGVADRMKSRLTWGLVADIYPTTYELRLGILQSKAEQRKMPVPSKVLEFLAHKITSNVRELEGALIRINAHSELVGRAITLESVQDVLQDQLRANDKRLTIEEIQKRVAEHYNIRLVDMSSERRARAVARPRQVAMYLAKQMTPRSLPEIGRKFGGRDHTTVLHAVRRIEALIKSDLSIAEDLDMLRRMLES